MFEYNIATKADEKIFNDIVSLIENSLPNAKKMKQIDDVDGTNIQTFTISNKDIDIYNDYEIDAVYIKSNYDLSDIDFSEIIQ